MSSRHTQWKTDETLNHDNYDNLESLYVGVGRR